MTPKLPLVVLLLVTGLTSGAAAQTGSAASSSAKTPAPSDLPTVNPYRPTVTDPASLTAPGYLEMEIGGADQHGGAGTHRAFSTPTVLKLTNLSRRLEYHIGYGGYLHQTGDDGTSATGSGDIVPGLQYLFTAQTPKTYDLAARIEYKIPAATRNLGTGKTDYDLLLLASKDYNSTLHGDYNLGIYQLGRASGRGFATQYQASAAFSTKLSDKLTLQDEVYAFSGSRETNTVVSTLHALGYQPARNLAFDAGIDIGLSHAAPKYTLLFGSTFFVGKLF